PMARDTKAPISDKLGVHEERCSSGALLDCRPGEGELGAPEGDPGGAEGGGPGTLGTAVGGACSGGDGKLLAGVRSSSGGVAPIGRSFAASLLSGVAAPLGFG